MANGKRTVRKDKDNESIISIILGALIVLVVGIIVFNFFSRINKRNANITSRQQATATPTIVPEVTKAEAVKQETKPTITVEPTKKIIPTNTIAPKKQIISPKIVQKASPTPTKILNLPAKYTVQAGDDLWSIAERYYKSGYNWLDIAKANKISNPNIIEVGMVLTLPKEKPIQPGTISPQAAATAGPGAITTSSYTVSRGDYLWNIAVRACGDGYKWVNISRDNRLENPDIIHAGNIFKINCK